MMPRCGGAAVKPRKRPTDAKLANTRVKMMKKMRQQTLMLRRKVKRTKKMLDAYAARK
jgi:hypothetical protein